MTEVTRGYSDDCDCLYCKGVRREREQDKKDAERKGTI
jgi:hypothetical protein